jgi:hypothetical protein
MQTVKLLVATSVCESASSLSCVLWITYCIPLAMDIGPMANRKEMSQFVHYMDWLILLCWCNREQRQKTKSTTNFLPQATMLETSTAKITQLSIKGGNWKGWSIIVHKQLGYPNHDTLDASNRHADTTYTVLWIEACLPYHVPVWYTEGKGIGRFKHHPHPPRNSEILTKLSRIPCSVENTSITT